MTQRTLVFGLAFAAAVSVAVSVAGCAKTGTAPIPSTELVGQSIHKSSDPNVIVHLFEWRWDDVAQECEQFLGPFGYSAVQVSPVTESALVKGRPWYEKYQPASYKLDNRSGDRAAFEQMVSRCKSAGVDIIVDVVLNHMTGVYTGTGNAGSSFSEYDYPGIYSFEDFHHCGTPGDEIQDWEDRTQVRECELVNLADLKTESEKVRTRLADFLMDLAKMGVKGIRIDAAKHMWPEDIHSILDRAHWDGYVVQEVNDTDRDPSWMPEYYATGNVTEMRYGYAVANSFRNGRLGELHVANGSSAGYERIPSDKALVFVDNHDTQRKSEIMSFKEGPLYALAQVFTLAYPYGRVRVMSSYQYSDHVQGPPMLENGDVIPVFDQGDVNCSIGAWVCEHRWPKIAGAVQFRRATANANVVSNWWETGGNQVAFGRGDLGFVVLNASNDSLIATLKTSMNPGIYCDRLKIESCMPITVQADGNVAVTLGPLDALAFDRESLK